MLIHYVYIYICILNYQYINLDELDHHLRWFSRGHS